MTSHTKFITSQVNFHPLFTLVFWICLLGTLTSAVILPNSRYTDSKDSNTNYQQQTKSIRIRYSQYKPENKDNPEITTYRENVFEFNKKIINQHNQWRRGGYRMGLNPYTSTSAHQFRAINTQTRLLEITQNITLQKLTVLNSTPSTPQKYQYGYQKILTEEEARDFVMNWTCYATKKIGQRGSCASSYIITALEATRILLAAVKFQYVSLSVQEIISCLPGPKTKSKGCEGGHYVQVYEYIKNIGVGIEQLYPQSPDSFSKGETPPCNTSIITQQKYQKNKVFIKDYKVIELGNCTELLYKLQKSPISVNIGGSQFQFYSFGTYTSSSLAKLALSWGLTLVGFDRNKGYYVRGSFGENWGINGYAYVDSTTGICNWATYPELDNTTPTKIPNC